MGNQPLGRPEAGGSWLGDLEGLVRGPGGLVRGPGGLVRGAGGSG